MNEFYEVLLCEFYRIKNFTIALVFFFFTLIYEFYEVLLCDAGCENLILFLIFLLILGVNLHIFGPLCYIMAFLYCWICFMRKAFDCLER
jgi:hypothetical protein